MTTLIFDIETNGLLHDVTHIHCLGIYDTETKQTLVYNDEGDTEPLTRGIQRLEDADLIVGHNIINYDLPVIRKLYPWFQNTGRVLDTLVLSRMVVTHLNPTATGWENIKVTTVKPLTGKNGAVRCKII